ncbi:MAG: hypothetical protein FP813_03660 [Desulfurivibrio sp.]|nr:hypothetical protein [Desulfurivibrio sp.]MBU4118062.1 hypothetical protein [Pseudomonadota bacterium]
MPDIIDKIRLRKFTELNWCEPESVLKKLRYIEKTVLSEVKDESIRKLRTNRLKGWREARDAAIFAYGLGIHVLKLPVFVAKSEECDYDFVVKWEKEGAELFCPVQLKELPPENLNRELTIDDIYKKLEKYSGEKDLAVAVKINRNMKFDFKAWTSDKKLAISELWYFGNISRDGSVWCLYGDVLNEPQYYEFRYPEAETEVA